MAMRKDRLVCPLRESPPLDSGRSTYSGKTLPYDLLQAASQRLAVMALLGAVLWLVGTVFYHFALRAMGPEGEARWMHPLATDPISALAIVGSLGLFWYARKADQDPKFILDLGLVYMVVTSMAVGFVMHWDPVPGQSHVIPMISWNGAIMLMFAAIVPNSPQKMLAAALVAACMNPIGMLVAKERGIWDFGPASNVLLMHYPDFILAGVSALISKVMTRLGQQIRKEREMGSYHLLTQLGKGGMGEVWRARHGMLARDAAVKLIKPELLSGISGQSSHLIQRRFEQEAKSTAKLRSPHTVELYDFGVTEEGVFYYVMELLDGIDLDTLVKTYGPQPAGRVVHILEQVCRSLADAHSHGMVHRDIKPSNIILCRMGGEYDYVKVLDFGLVKVVNSDSGLTGEPGTTGTPAYMPPELALNNPIDGRTDLYSLGCVGYWLLTGQLVFPEKGATAMMFAHIQDKPAPVSARSELPVPEWLDRAILQCLAKEPGQRPASAEALRKMLTEHGEDPSWRAGKAEEWWMTNLPGEPSEMVRPVAVAAEETTI